MGPAHVRASEAPAVAKELGQNCGRTLFGFIFHILEPSIRDNKNAFKRHRQYHQGGKVNEILRLKEKKREGVVRAVRSVKIVMSLILDSCVHPRERPWKWTERERGCD